MSSASRLVLVVWVLLVGCKPAAPRQPAVAAATCDDVGTRAAMLGSYARTASPAGRHAPSALFGWQQTSDPAGPTVLGDDASGELAAPPDRGPDARQRCLDEAWSQEVIDCFTHALTEAGAFECLSSAPPDDAVGDRQPSFELDCLALHTALLDALGGSMAFSSIQGDKLPADADSSIQVDEYESPLEVIEGHAGTITRVPAFSLNYYRVKVDVEPGLAPSTQMLADYDELTRQLASCLPGDWSADAPDPSEPNSTSFRADADRAVLESDDGDSMRNALAIEKQDQHPHIKVSIASLSAVGQSWLTLDVLTAGR